MKAGTEDDSKASERSFSFAEMAGSSRPNASAPDPKRRLARIATFPTHLRVSHLSIDAMPIFSRKCILRLYFTPRELTKLPSNRRELNEVTSRLGGRSGMSSRGAEEGRIALKREEGASLRMRAFIRVFHFLAAMISLLAL